MRPTDCSGAGGAGGGGGGGGFCRKRSDTTATTMTAAQTATRSRRGIVPDGGGCYILPRLIGLQKAKELIFFGDDVSAADAERLGLVNLVVPAAELEATARAWGCSTARSTATAGRCSGKRRWPRRWPWGHMTRRRA